MNGNVAPEYRDRTGAGKRTRVLIVDDSALMRQMLSEILSSDPLIEVVETARDAYDAREKIKRHNPDVITLDVEMPGMDGIQFLKNLMRLRPMPVVMISSLTEKGATVTLEALEIGAVDFIHKPAADTVGSFDNYEDQVIKKVKMAAAVKPQHFEQAARIGRSAQPAAATTARPRALFANDKIIAIGSSTGGTEALKHVLATLPENTPPIVVTQHIPASFSKSFADRLNYLCLMTVQQAEEGMPIEQGNVYVAPGDRHLLVKRQGGRLICTLDDGEPVNCHKPSVDRLFESVRETMGSRSIGVILTGMGDDGARQMKEMHDAGAYTIAQDEESSVVWGMPGQAVKRGAADVVLPLDEIAEKLLARLTVQQ